MGFQIFLTGCVIVFVCDIAIRACDDPHIVIKAVVGALYLLSLMVIPVGVLMAIWGY